MSWRTIADKAAVIWLQSWRIPGQMPGSSFEVETNCSVNQKEIENIYKQNTRKQIKPILPAVAQPFGDGIFKPNTEPLKKLNNSTFIRYSIGTWPQQKGTTDHIVTYMYDQKSQIWIPLQTWEGALSLADWLNVVHESNLYQKITNIKKQGFSPITHPRSYWFKTWASYIDQFNLTQLRWASDKSTKQLINEKLKKAQGFLSGKDIRITSVACDAY